MTAQARSRLAALGRSVLLLGGGTGAAIAAATLAGWALGFQVERWPVLGGTPAGLISPDTAVGILLAGLALCWLGSNAWPSVQPFAVSLLGAMVSALGLVVAARQASSHQPGHMGPEAAVGLVLVGFAILLVAPTRARQGLEPLGGKSLSAGFALLMATVGAWQAVETWNTGHGEIARLHFSALGALSLAVLAPIFLVVVWRLASTTLRQRRELEERSLRLYQSQEQLRLALEAGRIGTWQFDPGTGETRTDANCAALYGLRPSELAETEDYLGRVHPDDRQRMQEDLRTTAEGGAPYELTHRVCWPDGSIRHLAGRGELVRGPDGHQLMLGVNVDVTESKRAEEALRANEARLRQIVSNAPFPIMLHADDGEVLLVNAEWTRLSGYTPAEIPSIRAWTDLAYGEDAPAARAAIERLYQHRGSVSLGQFAIRTKDGGQRLWEFRSASLEPLPDGRRLVMSAAADVSNKDLARELARSNAELEQFAYVASHDLQEPLRMVASYVQLLERRYRGRLDEDADRFIGYAVDGARRMQALVSDLLAYSRAGRGPIPDAPVDTNEVLEGILANLRVRIEETGAQISFEALPHVRGHPTQIAMVLQNLIENAIKYRSDAPPRIHVGVVEREGERVLCVRDNGIGFDPSQSERIFRPFQRLHERDRYEGNGIGLALVERVVTYFGGRVWAESEPGQGACFYVALPMADPEEKDSPAAVPGR